MLAAGVEYGDVEKLVDTEGVEGALGALYDAGVRVSIDEFKGRRPIQRSGVDLAVRAKDFDNPFLRSHYESQTGGSRGDGARLIMDLDLLGYEAAHVYLGLQAQQALERPAAVWRPLPPAVTGMKEVFYRARLGRPPELWFSQNRYRWRRGNLKGAAMTACVLGGSRLWGRPLPRPQHLPLQETEPVARWLSEKRAAGTPPLLDANVSTMIRVCRAALEAGVNISGSLFRTGGEPYTPTRARIVEATGSRAACNYGLSETGRLGIACGRPAAPDDVHVLNDKVALLQRSRRVPGLGFDANAIYVSTLHPSTPKLMLNVEIGDHATPSRRECGCPLGAIGFAEHLDTIRSYEKLTSEGMHFVNSDILELLEKTLPERFGGGPTDYQLVEEEVEGLSRVSLLARPSLGDLDEKAVIEAVLASFRSAGEGHALMSRWWREGAVLRVERRDPHVTSAQKVPALHVRR